MGDNSEIEWTDATWNPLRGCSRVSDGCKNCYAERVAGRFDGPGQPYEGLIHRSGAWNGKITLAPHKLAEPIRWQRPRRIFVNSMSDLFHENVPFEYIDRVFLVMACTTRHTYQVLTKRPKRMLEYFKRLTDGHPFGWFPDPVSDAEWPVEWMPQRGNRGGYNNCGPLWPLENVWLGVSVEDQAAADERIPLLLQAPATVRFLSCEPLLGPIKLERLRYPGVTWMDCLEGREHFGLSVAGGGPHVDWVIAGGESGPKARPAHPDWFRDLRRQCIRAGVPFLFKQWGEWTPGENVDRTTGIVQTAHWFDHRWSFGREDLATNDNHIDDQPDVYRVGKKAAGRLLDGRTWDQFPPSGEQQQ